jgi:hypothetical protein
VIAQCVGRSKLIAVFVVAAILTSAGPAQAAGSLEYWSSPDHDDGTGCIAAQQFVGHDATQPGHKNRIIVRTESFFSSHCYDGGYYWYWAKAEAIAHFGGTTWPPSPQFDCLTIFTGGWISASAEYNPGWINLPPCFNGYYATSGNHLQSYDGTNTGHAINGNSTPWVYMD